MGVYLGCSCGRRDLHGVDEAQGALVMFTLGKSGIPVGKLLLLPLAGAVTTVEIGPGLAQTLNTILNIVMIVLLAHYGGKSKQVATLAETVLDNVQTEGGRRVTDPPAPPVPPPTKGSGE